MKRGEVVMEADATFTDKDVELYERATAVGIPSLIVSMYKTALQKLIADEREACAEVAYKMRGPGQDNEVAMAIRARGNHANPETDIEETWARAIK